MSRRHESAGRSSFRIAGSSWTSGRWRRWWRVATTLVWIVAVASLVGVVIDPSALAVTGAVGGVILGLLGHRYIPEIEEPTDWFGLRYVPDTRATARRASRSPAQGALVVLACAAAVALTFILLPLLDPFPEFLVLGFLAVALAPRLTRSRRPRAPRAGSAAPLSARTGRP